MRRQIKRYVFNMGFDVTILYRVRYLLYSRILWAGQTIAIAVRQFMRVYSSCNISPKAVISKCCKLPHLMGIVIGDGVIVEEKVRIWHRVTIGSLGRLGEELKYSVVERNVRIFNGATIAGPVILEEGCMVGAHAYVTKNVPAGAAAVGTPARVIKASR